MAYLPFARKYRPQLFEELIGQPHVTETLIRALKAKRIAQAYLFAGMRGVGKTSAARILAKCLNCEQGPTATPCQKCANCTQITAGSHLDVTEIDELLTQNALSEDSKLALENWQSLKKHINQGT